MGAVSDVLAFVLCRRPKGLHWVALVALLVFIPPFPTHEQGPPMGRGTTQPSARCADGLQSLKTFC